MRRLILFSALVLLFGGCAEADTLPADPTPVSGSTLEQLGYTLEIPNLLFYGRYPLNDWSELSTTNTFTIGSGFDEDYTVLYLWFSYINGSEPRPIMYLQAYKTEALAQNPVITVDDIGYRATGLDVLAVYADDDITVFDFYPILSPEDLEEIIKRDVERINSGIAETNANPPFEDYVPRSELIFEDYHYLLRMNDYFKVNIGDMIKKLHD